MKHLIYFIFFLLISVASFSCKDTTNNTTTKLEVPFEGITETSEKSPDPIGKIDPDDWKTMMNCSSFPKNGCLAQIDTVGPVEIIPKCTQIFPAFPNPANKVFTVYYTINETDSVVMTLNKSPSNVVKELVKYRQNAGAYSVTVDGSDLQSGIYRIYISVYRTTEILASYGDVELID